MASCGLDFGTSNTTLGVATGDGPVLCRLEGDERTLPSAIFFRPDGSALIGRAAIAAYVEGHEGRLMRSLKSVLGSSLLDETTRLGRRRTGFREVIRRYIAAVKARAEEGLGRELTAVVHGRPVHFVDGDAEADRRAEAALATIAHEVGFREVVFQFEPIAAALDYERQIGREEIALIADIGGGTSDFSIVRIGPERRRSTERGEDILANTGVRVGGVDFDRVLSLKRLMPHLGLGSPMLRRELAVPSRYFHELAAWHSINRLYDPAVIAELRQVRRQAAEPERLDRLIQVIAEERGHALAGAVEAAKIALAATEAAAIPLPWLADGPFDAAVDRPGLAEATAGLADRIAGCIDAALTMAGLPAAAIDALFLTGGSTRLAHVRAAIAAAVPEARVVEGDTFGSVGAGLAIEAGLRFGARVDA